MTETPLAAVTAAATKYEPWLRLVADLSATTVATAAASDTSATPSGLPSAFVDLALATEYFRPSGERYLPRLLPLDATTKVQDVAMIKGAYASGMPVLLYGEPGTGKTALVEAALPDVVTVQGSVETEAADFIGSWAQQPDGTYKWVDGPLVRAMEGGLPLLVDEIALIDPRVMSVVYGVMDGRDELVVTANPERGVVKSTEGFLVFGACNPNVPGALMSDALLSRFQLHVEVTTDWGLAKTLGVEPKIIQVARNLHLKARSGEVMAPPQLRELLTFKAVIEKFGQSIALRNFISQSREEDRDLVAGAIEAVYGQKPGALVI